MYLETEGYAFEIILCLEVKHIILNFLVFFIIWILYECLNELLKTDESKWDCFRQKNFSILIIKEEGNIFENKNRIIS